ncbi:Ger(x)C family spore germination protein [Virgibacillus kimchii]
MVKSILALLPVFISLIFTAACWDQVEIEERGFVIGNAIDLVEKKDGKYILQFTNQLVLPGGIGAPTMGEASGEQPYMNLSTTGESLYMLDTAKSKRTDQNPFYQHLKVLIISEDVLIEPQLFTDIMDVYLRSQDMRRTVRVIMTEGDASRILDIDPKTNPLPGMYIDKLMDSVQGDASAINPVNLGDLHLDLLEEKSFVLPKVKLEGNQVLFENAGVFRGEANQLVGILNIEETVGFNLLTENTKEGMLDIHVDGDLVQLEMTEFHTSMEITGEDKENLRAFAKVDVDANVVETFGSISLTDEEYEKKLEQHAEERAVDYMQQAIDKIQGELQVDVLGIGEILYRRHHPLWKEVEGNWDHGENYFSQMDIEVSASVNIERLGASDTLDN